MFLTIYADDCGQLIGARVTVVLRTGVSLRPTALGAATLVHSIGVVATFKSLATHTAYVRGETARA